MDATRVQCRAKCQDWPASLCLVARAVRWCTARGIVQISWNSTGRKSTRTLTPTLGMCLLCNFVNVYTIAYRVQYTCTCIHARIANGRPREENRACRTSRRGSSCVSGSWTAVHGERSYSCGRLNREVAGHADILVTILARKSAWMSVSVTRCPCRCCGMSAVVTPICGRPPPATSALLVSVRPIMHLRPGSILSVNSNQCGVQDEKF